MGKNLTIRSCQACIPAHQTPGVPCTTPKSSDQQLLVEPKETTSQPRPAPSLPLLAPPSHQQLTQAKQGNKVQFPNSRQNKWSCHFVPKFPARSKKVGIPLKSQLCPSAFSLLSDPASPIVLYAAFKRRSLLVLAEEVLFSHSDSRKIGLRQICTEYSIFTMKTVYKKKSSIGKVLLQVIQYGRVNSQNSLTGKRQEKQLMTIFKFRIFDVMQEKELKKRQVLVEKT